jgi:hypothetical protein
MFVLGCITAAALVTGSVGLFTANAFAKGSNGATNGTMHCNPSDPACGANPVITGPPPPFVVVPANCPSWFSTDAWNVNLTGGNSVGHGTSNSNGDWGGGTAEGPAVLTTSDGTPQYSGHATEWFGGGNNKAGQSEQGFTVNFTGTGIAGTISIHANGHMTTNNAGTQTVNFNSATVICS